MATAYSGEVAVGSYNRVRLKVDYSGTSATCTIQFRRTSSWSTTWSDANATLTFNGATKGAAYSYTGTVGTGWVDLKTVSGYSVSTSGGNYGWTFSNPSGGILGCSGTISIPAQSYAPTKPTCTASSNSATLVNVTWGTSNLGNPAGTVSLYEGTTNNPTELLHSKTTKGTSVFGRDQRTANTTYYYKAKASNSVGTVSSAVTSATTYPAGLTSLTATNVKPTEATLTAVFANSGNALTTGVEARINQSGSWNDLGLSDVQGTTQSITLSPFLPETTYTVELRVRTTAGTSSVSSVTFTTPSENKFYGSVNGQAKRITKLYGSVNGQTKKITKLYGSVNGVTKLIYKG